MKMKFLTIVLSIVFSTQAFAKLHLSEPEVNTSQIYTRNRVKIYFDLADKSYQNMDELEIVNLSFSILKNNRVVDYYDCLVNSSDKQNTSFTYSNQGHVEESNSENLFVEFFHHCKTEGFDFYLPIGFEISNFDLRIEFSYKMIAERFRYPHFYFIEQINPLLSQKRKTQNKILVYQAQSRPSSRSNDGTVTLHAQLETNDSDYLTNVSQLGFRYKKRGSSEFKTVYAKKSKYFFSRLYDLESGMQYVYWPFIYVAGDFIVGKRRSFTSD